MTKDVRSVLYLGGERTVAVMVDLFILAWIWYPDLFLTKKKTETDRLHVIILWHLMTVSHPVYDTF